MLENKERGVTGQPSLYIPNTNFVGDPKTPFIQLLRPNTYKKVSDSTEAQSTIQVLFSTHNNLRQHISCYEALTKKKLQDPFSQHSPSTRVTNKTNNKSARKPTKRVSSMETMSRNVFRQTTSTDNFCAAPPLSKYRGTNKTTKNPPVKLTQEAKPTLTFHRMRTKFLALSPLREKTTMALAYWRDRQGKT